MIRKLILSMGLIAVLFSGFLFSPHAHTIQLHIPFDQMLQKAEVIFVGKVIDQQCRYGFGGKMIFTDVYFEILDQIYGNESSPGEGGKAVVLTFGGGRIGEEELWLSDIPIFNNGSTYLVFTLMDGNNYLSPIIGSYQGVFRVISDEANGDMYPLTYGGGSIAGIREDDLVKGPRVNRIRNRVVEKTPEEASDRRHSEMPRPRRAWERPRPGQGSHKEWRNPRIRF